MIQCKCAQTLILSHAYTHTNSSAFAIGRIEYKSSEWCCLYSEIIFRIRSDEKTNAKIQITSNGKFVKDYNVLDNKSSKLLFHKYCCYICHFEFGGAVCRKGREIETLPLNTHRWIHVQRQRDKMKMRMRALRIEQWHNVKIPFELHMLKGEIVGRLASIKK